MRRLNAGTLVITGGAGWALRPASAGFGRFEGAGWASAAFGGFGGLRVTPGTGRDLPPPSSCSPDNSMPKYSITAAAVRRVAAARATATLRVTPLDVPFSR